MYVTHNYDITESLNEEASSTLLAADYFTNIPFIFFKFKLSRLRSAVKFVVHFKFASTDDSFSKRENLSKYFSILIYFQISGEEEYEF